ncbi:MAG TPA: LCP family protein [Streptosporangiaceae bacterium]|jgi:anionic cell wall polymer biosynthesis LytR-Cps2A-Psr (LCP) family protein
MGLTRGGRDTHDDAPPYPRQEVLGRAGGFGRALALTFASALLWGFAHLWMGRRRTGLLLLALYWLLVAAVVVLTTTFRQDLLEWAVRPRLLTAVTIGSLVLGLVWVSIVIRSYQIARPAGAPTIRRAAAHTTVGVLCLALIVPFAWAARYTNVYRDTLTSIFQGGADAKPVNTDNPWAGRRRVNVLLLGGDAAGDRVGVRTDSMTLASVDTTTGDTVLLSLPRNLEHFPMPAGPAHERFPNGFTGDGPENPGLLNEVFEYAENHPDVVPGVPKKWRGPTLITQTISGILDQPIDYYILVDMFGFADIVDAMGGVKIKIDKPIPYGQEGGVLQPGYRTLHGKEALWYGRSRNDSDDYVRMGRQKCLLRAIAQQANPQRVLTRFEQLASATKRAISTDIPQGLLPALIQLSGKVKNGADITSLQFVPPLISTGSPDFPEIRRLAAKAIADSEAGATSATGPPGAPGANASSSATSSASPAGDASPNPESSKAQSSKAQSLAATCPS